MRLMVTGPMGAGKSTFIRSVSEIKSVHRASDDVDASMEVSRQPSTLTSNFGELNLGADRVLSLYKTPIDVSSGRLGFDLLWHNLIQQAHAYILLVPANQPREFRRARLIYRFIQNKASLPMIFGLTHTDCIGSWDFTNVALALGFVNLLSYPQMVTLDARDQVSVKKALMVLVEQCLKVA